MRKGERTRQRIIEQSAPIFNQQGFAGSSIQDILEVTGLEKGGLYRHFGSKEELAVAAFRYSVGNSMRLRTEAGDLNCGSIEHLRVLIRRFIETPSTTPGGCPLMNTAIDSDDGNPVLRGLALDGIHAWRARLIAVVEGGIAAREIYSDVEPRTVANTVIATLEGALMISRLEETSIALTDAQVALGILLDHIASPAQPAEEPKTVNSSATKRQQPVAP